MSTTSGIHGIEVRAGSRLHFGLLRPAPDAGRAFGGAGMMIDLPAVIVQVRKTIAQVPLTSDIATRLAAVLQRYCQLDRDTAASFFSFAVPILPNLHTGLGTGTQLALAAATALARLNDRLIEPEVLAANIAGRGKRSAVGTHGFFRGGLIIDAGSRSPDQLGELKQRVDVPEHWRIVTVTPPSTETSVSGAAEEHHFTQCPVPPAHTVLALEALLDEELLPAVEQADFRRFAESLTRYNRDAGNLFAAVQGGPYNGQPIAELVGWITRQGTFGVGQSSWGPTAFAVCSDEELATWLCKKLASICLVGQISKPLNRGASIRELSRDP